MTQRRRQTLNLEPEMDRKDTREAEKQPERVCVPLRTRLSLCPCRTLHRLHIQPEVYDEENNQQVCPQRPICTE